MAYYFLSAAIRSAFLFRTPSVNGVYVHRLWLFGNGRVKIDRPRKRILVSRINRAQFRSVDYAPRDGSALPPWLLILLRSSPEEMFNISVRSFRAVPATNCGHGPQIKRDKTEKKRPLLSRPKPVGGRQCGCTNAPRGYIPLSRSYFICPANIRLIYISSDRSTTVPKYRVPLLRLYRLKSKYSTLKHSY